MRADPHPNPLPRAGEGEIPGVGFRQAGGVPVSVSDSLSRVRERVGVRVQRARALRHQATDAEQYLWRHLRASQLQGHKFRRQHPVGPYFADFACIASRLIVELDGGQHASGDGMARDAARSRFLQSQGWQVLRFWNHQVLTELPGVLQVIVQTLLNPHPHPLPQAGEGEITEGYWS